MLSHIFSSRVFTKAIGRFLLRPISGQFRFSEVFSNYCTVNNDFTHPRWTAHHHLCHIVTLRYHTLFLLATKSNSAETLIKE